MKFLIRILIRFYQRFVSPVIHAIGGPNSGCRFYPTCSDYFLQAVERHGVFKGSFFGIKRLCRCHPWGGCGDDPVPPKKSGRLPSRPERNGGSDASSEDHRDDYPRCSDHGDASLVI